MAGSLPLVDARPSAGDPRPRCVACGGTLGPVLLEGRDRLYGLAGTFSVARCEACAIGVTLPLVAAGQLASFYPSSYGAYDPLPRGAAKLISLFIHRFLAWQALHTLPLQRLARLPPGRLLDVGCGRGDLGSWFVRRHWTVVGVEPSARACAVARGRGVDARCGSSAVALPASIQYLLAGRCLFPSGTKLRIAIAACALTTPVSWLTNRFLGEGDVLHAIAHAS